MHDHDEKERVLPLLAEIRGGSNPSPPLEHQEGTSTTGPQIPKGGRSGAHPRFARGPACLPNASAGRRGSG
eukprot:7401850-Pyramimonas_sp.AAC.1